MSRSARAPSIPRPSSACSAPSRGTPRSRSSVAGPSDGRYGENPNRAGAYYQFQVGLKPSPLHVQDLYLDSLRAIGLDPAAHDVRFVEDDWESPTLGAWGLGWEVWCDGMEVTQFTYFQQAGGIDLLPVTAELTYGVERIAMYLQNVDNMYDLKWDKNVTYGQLRQPWEVEYSTYQFEELDPKISFTQLRHVRGRVQASARAHRRHRAARPAGLRVLHEGVARVQLPRRARRDQRDRAPAVHRSRARHGEGVRGDLRRARAPPWASRCCRSICRRRPSRRVPRRRARQASMQVRSPPRGRSRRTPRRSHMPADLLFEIGCEEIPAKMLARALAELPAFVELRLGAARLEHKGVRALGTPRRLDDHRQAARGSAAGPQRGGRRSTGVGRVRRRTAR